jgi:hypothetical protein
MQQQIVSLKPLCGAHPARASAARSARQQRPKAVAHLRCLPTAAASAQQQELEQQQQQLAAGEAPDLVQKIMAYEYVVTLPDGAKLVVSALRPQWLVRTPPACSLLTREQPSTPCCVLVCPPCRADSVLFQGKGQPRRTLRCGCSTPAASHTNVVQQTQSLHTLSRHQLIPLCQNPAPYSRVHVRTC